MKTLQATPCPKALVESNFERSLDWSSGSIIMANDFTVTMSSGELDHLLRDYFEAKFGAALDYLVIGGQMSPDAKGDMGVTGTYRKKAGDKEVYFTITVNLTSHTFQNLQEYS
jgi:hypothetical protein